MSDEEGKLGNSDGEESGEMEMDDMESGEEDLDDELAAEPAAEDDEDGESGDDHEPADEDIETNIADKRDAAIQSLLSKEDLGII